MSDTQTEPSASAVERIVEIPLTKGMVAVIDAADLPLVSGRSWFAKPRNGGWYARGHVPGSGHRGRAVFMHTLLMPGAAQIDHRDGDGLNNRRENLRPATRTQNNANQRKYRGTSRYKGVSWDVSSRRWRARIHCDHRETSLGQFTSEADAARAYNAAALEHFGEYARLNEIPE